MHTTSPAFSDHYEIPFREGPTSTGILCLDDLKETGGYEMTLHRGSGETLKVSTEPFWQICEIGTVDLYSAEEGQAIFIAEGSGGSGGSTLVLHLVAPRSAEVVELAIHFSHQETERLTEITTSSNFHDSRLAREREFLESLKYDYGFVDEAVALRHRDDIEFAAYFWEQANGTVTDGPMLIRRLEGRYACGASVNDQVVDGDIEYTAFFKGAVWAYDHAKDESFVVFHPVFMYCWPTDLRKSGDWLLINTRGEGLAFVNTDTWHLKRVAVDVREVTGFSVSGNQAVINGSLRVALP